MIRCFAIVDLLMSRHLLLDAKIKALLSHHVAHSFFGLQHSLVKVIKAGARIRNEEGTHQLDRRWVS